MAIDLPYEPNIGDDYLSFVVDTDGTCVLNPFVPELVGGRPWEWCIPECRDHCREAFVSACMFRKMQHDIEVVLDYKGFPTPVTFQIYPLETGQVLCLFKRRFSGKLTDRERHVLVLTAGGATSAEVGEALGISASTVRDYVGKIKQKLQIHAPAGLRLAARHYGLSGSKSE